MVHILEEFLHQSRIRRFFVKDGFGKQLHRGKRRFQLVRCIGNEFVPHAVVRFDLFAHPVKRTPKFCRLIAALHFHADTSALPSHAADRVRQFKDRFCDNA